MEQDQSFLKPKLISKIRQLYQDHHGQACPPLLDKFIDIYYANVPYQDLQGYSAEALLGAVLSLWNFGKTRQGDTSKLRIFSPDVEELGWTSHHTIIETINTDTPFIVDSLLAELNTQEYAAHIIIHPIINVKRDKEGHIIDIKKANEPAEGYRKESWIHVEIDTELDKTILKGLECELTLTLKEVRLATSDWRNMLDKAEEVRLGLKHCPKSVPQDILDETAAFISWMENNHFTFLGYREYKFVEIKPQTHIEVVEDSGLGILRDEAVQVFDGQRHMKTLPPEILSFIERPELMLITKTNRKSRVHRAVQMDGIVIKKFNEKGEIESKRLFIGLFTSIAYSARPQTIPFIERKVRQTIIDAGFAPSSHNAKALQHILETYPRDELFQISAADLTRISLGILHLQERQRVALFVRQDAFERFVSALVFIPRDRYNNFVRKKIQKTLEEAFHGVVTAFYPQMSDESVLARMNYIIKTEPGNIPPFNMHALEQALIEASRDWNDELKLSLIEKDGEAKAIQLFKKYQESFPGSYRERTNAALTVLDIHRMEKLYHGNSVEINLYTAHDSDTQKFLFKLYHLEVPVYLSFVLPMLENLGVNVIDENAFQITPPGLKPIWIHEFSLKLGGDHKEQLNFNMFKQYFEEAFLHIWRGGIANDPFNQLISYALLSWQDVLILRLYAKYLRQTQIGFSQEYIQETLKEHIDITKDLIALFHMRFDIRQEIDIATRHTQCEAWLQKILVKLDQVKSLDQDRILKAYANCIQSTLRTNFFQTEEKPYVSIKLDSQNINDLPLPKPMVEIFVYNVDVEGIHLRGGKVARGGIRWSNRREDFRTEVLGLMKAQMVKNAVIVPVGSKGGFVAKNLNAYKTREEIQEEVIRCYQIFIKGLLDITDNIVSGSIVSPPDVVKFDDDDPYLVVAADKGTATFSDIANSLSLDYRFWLGDAFASGGSYGYDHKKMGITARGAWESVKRHFRELGKDIQKEPFTVIGVGDMSGDVFGNGMLLSRCIKLVAAFNHMHIFIDPEPNPEMSFKERSRLFDLPRSGWNDYNPEYISEGGGVFDRSQKSIILTPQIKALTGLREEQVTPNQLIQALLKAKTDLLWFGGIGTYVKATLETHDQVGDRNNDMIRVNASELQCLCIGEGANLGVTQKARVEFALAQGKINTDSIDNSAGVDCSDHEVNIKILLNELVAQDDLTFKKRNELLSAMTENVAVLVLRDNYLQTQALSVELLYASNLMNRHSRLMNILEKKERLNRVLDSLPNFEELQERNEHGIGLTRPELALLLLHTKNDLYAHLLTTNLAKDPFFEACLINYFPKALQKAYPTPISQHKLHDELILTSVVNQVVNRAGLTFVHETHARYGYSIEDIIKVFMVVVELFQLEHIWHHIESLDGTISATLQLELLHHIQTIIETTSLWFLRKIIQDIKIDAFVSTYQTDYKTYQCVLKETLTKEGKTYYDKRLKTLTKQGITPQLAEDLAGLTFADRACDVITIAHKLGINLKDVMSLYFQIGDYFGFYWLEHQARLFHAKNDWDKIALTALIEDFASQQSALTEKIILDHQKVAQKKHSGKINLEAWVAKTRFSGDNNRYLLEQLKQTEKINLSMLIVANRSIRNLLNA